MVYQRLIDEKIKIQIVETGCGVPFTAKLLEHSGSSDSLIKAYCPYSKAIQKMHGVTKSVSLDTVKRFIDPEYVSIVHTGAIYSNYSHGYIGVCDDFIHYKANISSRIEGINAAREAIEWAVSYFLFREQIPFNHTIDQISTNDLSLLFLYSKLLCFSNGQFVRPEDILRENKTIFRGSFNPPHFDHQKVGAGAIWEVTKDNFSKGSISDEDIMHRIKMINSLGNTVLVTRECPKFTDLLNILPGTGYNFIVGDDVAERISPEDRAILNLTVVPRGEISSTSIRSGNIRNLSMEVIRYIKKHRLYNYE